MNQKQNKKDQAKNNTSQVNEELLNQVGLEQAKPIASVQQKTLD